MYRSKMLRRREHLATAFLWLLAVFCAVYIGWKINPDPIKMGLNWTTKRLERTVDSSAKQLLFQMLPEVSYLFSANPNAQSERADDEFFAEDPFYSEYQSFSMPGDG